MNQSEWVTYIMWTIEHERCVVKIKYEKKIQFKVTIIYLSANLPHF